MGKTFNKYIGEFVYGSIDGTVTTFAVVCAVSGATLSTGVILVLGIANIFADGFSMASSNFLSERSKNNGVFESLKTAFTTFISFILVGLIPLTPYIFNFNVGNLSKFQLSCIITLFTFMFIGFVRGHISKQSKLRASLETFLVGGGAAVIAYFAGTLLKDLI